MLDTAWPWLLGLPLAGLAAYAAPVLLARYDQAALRVQPPAPSAPWPVGALPARGMQALLDWCFQGTAPGRRPLWWPWGRAQLEQRFAVAALAGAASGPALAEALSRHIDGSDQLQTCASGRARIGLRLRVKWHDLLWWRARRPDDPWDSGYLVDGPAALAALQSFRPRRASLLVCVDLPAPAVQARVAVLRAGQSRFAHPVRLLVVGTPVQAAWGPVTTIGF